MLLKTLLKPVEIPQVQFLGWFFHARRCATTGPCGPDSSVWKCRRCSSCGCGRPWAVSPVLKTVEVPQLQYFQGGRVPVVPVEFPSAGVEKTAEIPHCSRAWDKVVDMPVCATTVPMAQFNKVVDVPVIFSLCLLLEVPQTLFIPRVVGLQCAQRHGLSAGFGDEGVGAHHTGDELN